MNVIAMYVTSADGKIAFHPEDSLDWVSSDDRKQFRKETIEAGVVVMGRKTYESIGKPLEHRLNIVHTRSPEKFTKEHIEGTIEFTKDSASKTLADLEKRGHKTVFVIGGQSIYSEYLKNELIDELWITVEPVLFGKGINPFEIEPELPLDLELKHITTINPNTAMLRYYVK